MARRRAPRQSRSWLADSGTYELARGTRAMGLPPRTIPVSSPQSNGMAGASVRTRKRDYALPPKPDAQTVIEHLQGRLTHYLCRTPSNPSLGPASETKARREISPEMLTGIPMALPAGSTKKDWNIFSRG